MDNPTKIAVIFGILAVVIVFVVFPFVTQFMSLSSADNSLRNWDTTQMIVTHTVDCGHGSRCILDNYTYKNVSYTPRQYELVCHNCSGAVDILVNPADPTQSMTVESAESSRDFNSNPITYLFNIGGFCCLGIPFLALIIIVTYLKTRKGGPSQSPPPDAGKR